MSELIAMNRPLVSIVIASYNHFKYIEEAIKSISSQNYHPFELIVIDDGSTDGSSEFLEELKNKYNFRLIHRKNGGLVSVINLGIKEACGDYIVFHASDDESFQDRILNQVSVLEKYPNAAFISSNLVFLSSSGAIKGLLLPETGQTRELEFDDVFLHRAIVSSVTSMYRRSALLKMESLNEAYRAEDPQIFLRLTRMGYSWIQWAGPPVIAYRMLFTSQSRTTMLLLLRQNIQLVNEFSDHPFYSKALAQIRTCLVSSLAEVDKYSAIKEIFSGGINFFSIDFMRAAIKILIPKMAHHFFKRAGGSF